jgi:hypothetical protein
MSAGEIQMMKGRSDMRRRNWLSDISALLRKVVSGDIEVVPQGRDENEE